MEVMDRIGGGEGGNGILHSVLGRPLPGSTPSCFRCSATNSATMIDFVVADFVGFIADHRRSG